MNGLIDILLNKHVLINFSFIIIAIILFALRNKLNNKTQKIITLIPFFICVIHFIIFHISHNITMTLFYYGSIYATSIWFLLLLLPLKDKKIYEKLVLFTIAICAICFYATGNIMASNYSIHNFSRLSYTDSFKSLIKTLKKEYVLNDHKKINYDELEKEYLPLIEQAEKEKNEALYYETIFKFIDNFHDGHVGATCLNETCWETMKKYSENNFYGFDTILLDDGRIIAIQVDEESDAYKKGLRDYYTILKRDDREISEYLNDYYFHSTGEPVLYNERLLKSTKIFYRGEDTTTISYLDKKNKEHTITINNQEKKEKPFYSYLFYYRKFNNFDSEMLTENIGYININSERIDRNKDLFSYLTRNTKYAKKKILNKLDKLKEQGMEKLVIDLRNNMGGFFHISGAYAEIFTKDSYTYSKSKRKFLNHYDDYKVKGSGEYQDLPIVVLVNSSTISAGDTFLELLSRNPNVTIIGLMPSNNSGQEIGGQIYMTDSSINIFYALFNTEKPDGGIYIDTDDSRIETIKLDIKIPINEETVSELLKDDYVLNYAIDYLKK